ncbi:hypothetical protein Q0F98_18955 [Paenibacillus amylolyticus]|nr:hypothetical protein Q0F98_18955 [Paenibacillus amylolyticus]
MMLKPRLTKYMVMMLVLMLSISNVGLAAAADKELSKIVVSKNEMSLEVGDSSSVTVTGVYSDNTSANVTISSSWSTSDASIATVYNGAITAKRRYSDDYRSLPGSESDRSSESDEESQSPFEKRAKSGFVHGRYKRNYFDSNV